MQSMYSRLVNDNYVENCYNKTRFHIMRKLLFGGIILRIFGMFLKLFKQMY